MSPITNPDFRSYVDLTVFDKDAQTIFEQAIERLAVDLPMWTPREGNVEVLMLEAFAFEVAEALYAINRLPASTVEILLQLFGIFRGVGTQPQIDVEFTVYDGSGYTIPQGTQAFFTVFDGVEPIVFSTDQDLVIPAGSTVGTTSATGNRYTTDANAVASGTLLTGINTLSQVNSIQVVSVLVPGADPENDSAWLQRGTQRFAELSDALVVASQFQAAAVEDTAVHRAQVIDNYNPASGNAPGGDPGHLTVFVYGTSAPVSNSDKADLQLGLKSRAHSALAVHVADATIETLPVTVVIVPDAGYDPAQAIVNVQAALQSYLSIDQWNWATTVYRNQLISIIGAVEGVAYVSSLTAPASDYTVTDVAPLIVAGLITVTTAES